MFQQVESFSDALSTYLGISETALDKVVLSLLLVLLIFVLRRAAAYLLERRIDDPARRYIATKTIGYVLGIGSVFVLLRIWLGGISGLAASIGIISAGVAIALHQPLTNLVGWIFLTIRRPFVVGDRIQIGGHAGDVIDMRLFAFSLVEIGNWVDADQSTGRILHIPNGMVFQQAVANYTQGFNFIWDEMPITVTFESDWRKAKRILTEIIQRHSAVESKEAQQQVRKAASKFLIKYEHLTPIVWTSVADIGVTLTIRYLTDPRRRRSTENAIWEDVLDAFWAVDDIDFAYPTTRYYDNRGEGKPGRPPGSES